MSRRGRDSYVPRDANHSSRHSGRSQPAKPGGDNNMYHFGGHSQKRHEFSFRSRISQRDLLTHTPSSHETRLLSQNHVNNKFRDVENLTDSEEEEMDEDDSGDEDRIKRRKTTLPDACGKPKTQWSNPDPYTALPPAPDSAHRRVDVVRLIRKARNDVSADPSPVAGEDDFISFHGLDIGDRFAVPEDAPIGPRADYDHNLNLDKQPSKKVLGKRKHDEYENDDLMGNASRTQYHRSGKILAAWLPRAGSSATPWLEPCEFHDSPMAALHREIIDFYEWVKPKDFESAIRRDLVDRLSGELRRWRSSGKLDAFGSYAAGLYLPTGDMDLVYNYSSARASNPKREVYEAAKFLGSCGLARPGSVQPIAKAKVPIVKFIDDLTGLKVDLSFNNDTGVAANATFKKWQATYPAVPIIVTVVKQFLMIRGLNDNSVGGLGGFATICMVTSLVQNLPTQKSQNLGELLIEFFNLYGNLLNVENVGIRMEPPGYINKKTHHPMRDEKSDRLVIIDPNRPDNNITGGSSQYRRISNLFSQMYDIILSRLEDFAGRNKQDRLFSFLAELVGGNFSAYDAQRAALLAVYQPGHRETVGETPLQPFERFEFPKRSVARLAKIKALFPEIAYKLESHTSIGPNEVLKVGGWSSKKAMQRDITSRELQAAKKTKKR